jgi:hypothetical protein
MLTAQEYRVKAAEYAGLAETARSVSESREFRALARNCASLAANKDSMAGVGDHDQALPASRPVDHVGAEEEQILKCLGAAVIMRWTTLPRKVQRELFEDAGSIGDLLQTTELKRQIARFLHHHNDDVQNTAAYLP